MEKKKLLLVAISVGIFLVIAIGAAIVVFAPKSAAASSSALANHSTGAGQGITVLPPSPGDSHDFNSAYPDGQSAIQPAVDATELLRNNGNVPGLRSAPEGTVPSGSDFYVGRNGETVINVPKPSSAAIPEPSAERNRIPGNTQVRSSGSSSSASSTGTGTTSAPRTTSAPASGSAAQAAPKPAAQVRPAVQTRVYDDYWVQTGAFSTIARAEGVKESLSSRGINSIIENREVSGSTVFRVRVGPYTSKNEADYWLSLIKSINGFEDSQVRQTQSRR